LRFVQSGFHNERCKHNLYGALSGACGGQVAIMATSMTDSTKKANTSVMITGSSSNASLKGKYALLLTAATGNQGTSVIAASVTAAYI